MQSPRKSVPLWWNRFPPHLAKQSNICVPSSDCHSPMATSREAPDLYSGLGLFLNLIFIYLQMLLLIWTLEELLVRRHLFCLMSFLKLAGTGQLKVNFLILLWRPDSVCLQTHLESALFNPTCQTLESVEITVSSEAFALGPIFFPFSPSSQTLKCWHKVEDEYPLLLGNKCAVCCTDASVWFLLFLGTDSNTCLSQKLLHAFWLSSRSSG